jgi:alkylated DNA nucleotide flippase Atl1
VARSDVPRAPREPNPEFAEAVLDVVAGIPEGMAMAYGDVASAIGSRAPRAVGAVMAWYGGDVPWWRVVRASGHPVRDHERRALEHYRSEGTPLVWSADRASFRVDLRVARYNPVAE